MNFARTVDKMNRNDPVLSILNPPLWSTVRPRLSGHIWTRAYPDKWILPDMRDA